MDGLATVGQAIAGVAGVVLVGAAIRLWSRSASRPRRRRKRGDDGSRWSPSIGAGAGYGVWGGGAGGDAGGGDVGGDGGGCG